MKTSVSAAHSLRLGRSQKLAVITNIKTSSPCRGHTYRDQNETAVKSNWTLKNLKQHGRGPRVTISPKRERTDKGNK